MRGLTIVLTRAVSLRAALELAAAQAALGAPARVFCQGEAVAALAQPLADTRDPDHAAAGLPALAALFEEALGLGVTVIACQSGLALVGLGADGLDPRIDYGGAVSVLQTLGGDRLIAL